MGKKRRLNRLISRWIKSDLPEEDSGSTVLLLGVTRIPSSPIPRRPRSLALQPTHNHHPSNVSNAPRPISVVHPYSVTTTSCTGDIRVKSEVARLKCRTSITTSSSAECDVTPTNDNVALSLNESEGSPSISENMERSVDSIGTCSLDVDASAELLSDRCENPSVDTLRSNTSIKSLTPQQEHRLPSYLSLACTVNGYSQITNYDPIRFARSRDSSPHRPLVDHEQLNYTIQNNLLSPPNLVPLPLTLNYNFPITEANMSERTTTITTTLRQEEFYSKKMFSTRKYTSYISDGVDRVDACIEKKFNGHQTTHEKLEINGHNHHTHAHSNGTKIETKSFIQQRVERLYGPGALAQGFFVMKRQKSRLSESDAPVQNDNNLDISVDKHSKSMSDKLLLDDADNTMKQSASSPSLPVLRHLTPEFRAQLPTFSPRRGVDTIQKSNTLPQLKDVVTKPEIMINGKNHDAHHETNINNNLNGKCVDIEVDNLGVNALELKESSIEEDVKDGHYFLKILENETVRLLALADRAEEELNAGEGKLCENAKGFLRSAAGKARLLVSQKMQQFKGLCTNNLNQADGEAFPTTNQDLQGFWDMVMLQVDQIDSIFRELDVLRANNWQEIIKTRPEDSNKTNGKAKIKMAIGPSSRTRSAGAEEARVKRELQRKQMLEQRRRAMREAKASNDKSIEIFVPESS